MGASAMLANTGAEDTRMYGSIAISVGFLTSAKMVDI